MNDPQLLADLVAARDAMNSIKVEAEFVWIPSTWSVATGWYQRVALRGPDRRRRINGRLLPMRDRSGKGARRRRKLKTGWKYRGLEL